MVRGRSLPKQMKEKIIEALNNGDSLSEVSRRFAIPKQTVYSIKKRFQERGHLDNMSKSGRPKKHRLDKTGKYDVYQSLIRGGVQ